MGLLNRGIEEALSVARELLNRGIEEALSGGAAATRGCSIKRGRKLFLVELPLRGAARLGEGGSSFWGSCRYAA